MSSASFAAALRFHSSRFAGTDSAGALRVARRLPFAFDAKAGFELPLGPAAPALDFSLGLTRACLEQAPWDRRTLTRRRLPRDAVRSRAWARVFAFLERWGEDPVLSAAIRVAWLEFDASDPRRRFLPSLFADVVVPAGGDPTRRGVSRRGTLDAIGRLAEQTGGGRSWEAAAACLAEVIAATARRCRGYHIGFFDSRERRSVRMCVKDVLPAAILETLAARVPGADRPRVRALLEAAAATRSRYYLDLDLGSEVHPRVAVEIHCGRGGGDARGGARRRWWDRQAWERGLERLVASGTVSDAQRRFLLAWPGGAREPDAGGAEVWHTRNLSHLKVAVAPGRPLAAKAYFWFARERVVVDAGAAAAPAA